MVKRALDWWKLRGRLGLESDGVGFFPYWQPECPVRDLVGKALVSAYRVDDRRVVVAIYNRGSAEIGSEVAVDLARFGWPSSGRLTVADERGGADVAWDGRKFKIQVKGRNYALVSITRSL